MNMTTTLGTSATPATSKNLGGNTMNTITIGATALTVAQTTNNLMVGTMFNGLSTKEEKQTVHLEKMMNVYFDTAKVLGGDFREKMYKEVGTSFIANNVHPMNIFAEGSFSIMPDFVKDLKVRYTKEAYVKNITKELVEKTVKESFSEVDIFEKLLGGEKQIKGFAIQEKLVYKKDGETPIKEQKEERIIIGNLVRTLKYPTFEFVTADQLLELIASERVTKKFAKLFAENPWAKYAVKDGNVYSANFYVAKETGKPEDVSGFETVNTEEYFNTIIEQLREQVIITKTSIDAKEFFFANEVVKQVTKESELYNATLFNYAGTLELFRNSDRKIFTELLSGYFVARNWAPVIVSNRAEAEFVFKNEWSAMQSGVGSTAVEFKTFFLTEKIKRRVYSWVVSTKSNRFMNSNAGAVNAGGFREMLNNDIPVLLMFVGKDVIERQSHMLNAAFANAETFETIKPEYLSKKITRALKKGQGITAKVQPCALKRQMTLVNFDVLGLEETEEVKMLENFYGKKAPIILVEGEPKAEYGAWLALQQEIKNFLAGSDFELPMLSEKLETMSTMDFNVVDVTIKQGEKESKVTAPIMLAPFSFHYGKDSWEASGKSCFGKTKTTIQGLQTLYTQFGDLDKIKEEKIVDLKEYKKVLASAGMKSIKANWEQTNDFTWFASIDAQPSSALRMLETLYQNNRVINAEQADVVYGEQDTTKANGFILDSKQVLKIKEKTEGMEVVVNKKNNLLTAKEVTEIFEVHEILTSEEMYSLKTVFDLLLADNFELTNSSSALFRMLEKIRVIQLDADVYLPFTCTSKVIRTMLPTEFVQALLVYRATSDFSLDEIENFDKVVFMYEIKNNVVFKKRFAKYLEISKTKDENTVEVDGMNYRIKPVLFENVTSAKAKAFAPMYNLRKEILTKGAKDYLTQELNRAWLTVTTHKENTNIVFVNKSLFMDLIELEIATEHDSRFFISTKRYPETMIAQITFELQIDNSIAANTICVADVALAILMGDTDGDMLEVIKPFDLSLETLIHKTMKAYRRAMRNYYDSEYDANESIKEAVSKFGKIFKEFGDNSEAAICSLKQGILLNEGTEAKTGTVIAWVTKMSSLLIGSGAEKTLVEDFKNVLGAYLAQITIASKNNSAKELEAFAKNWSDFAQGTQDKETVLEILKAVTCKYL